jgi:para-nitrobenzyl esterase
MLYIHGGGFHYGSGLMHAVQHGASLARRGDVVVISVNHRLGVLGYLYLAELAGPEFADSGNVGMLDLILALRWVKENIESFGGDPGNVTIFGQSGGGAKVSTLLAMPAAEGLFHRAIIQSGARLRGSMPDAATANAKRVLDELGVGADPMSKLRSLSAAQLVEALPAVARKSGEAGAGGGGLGPVVDGTNLPGHPFHPTAAPFSKSVAIMVGSTRDELTYQLIMHPDFGDLDEAGLRRKLAAQLASRRDRFDDVQPAQIEHLITSYRERRPAASPADLLVALASDGTRLASIRLAERRSDADAAPVFMYLVTWESPALKGALGSTHCIDLPFVFDNLALAEDFVGRRPEREKLASQMSDAWISFARNGDPGHVGLLSWPAYSRKNRATMIFDAESRIEDDPLGIEREAWAAII